MYFVIETSSDSRGRLSLQSRYRSLLSATNQTKIYISLFTIKIKKETRGGLSVRVFLPRIWIKLTIGNVATDHSSPKPFREYRFELRMHTITTPIQVLLVLFSKEKNRKTHIPASYILSFIDHNRTVWCIRRASHTSGRSGPPYPHR